jgi:hypothetical protein
VADPASTGRDARVAVMQPYFFPYAGYFRLFAAARTFVIFDSVQFPRYGRVHRTAVPGPGGAEEWLTLPLAYHALDTAIRDLTFAPAARATFDARLRRLAWVQAARGPSADRLRGYLAAPLCSVVAYLEAGLRLVAALLGFDVVLLRSSRLGLDPSLRGQARVIAAAAAVGARCYVNLSGGRGLYDEAGFAGAGMRLAFLPPYDGRYRHLLPALMTETADAVRADIDRTTRLTAP